MWQRFAILAGGNALIVVSFAWVWVFVSMALRCRREEPTHWIGRSDLKTVLTMMAIWSSLWCVFQIVEGLIWLAN